MIGAILQQALGSLRAHPLRSALTALSVTFGTAVLTILVSYGSAMPGATQELLYRLGSTEFTVETRWRGFSGGRRRQPVRIRYTDIPAIRDACPSIQAVAPTFNAGRGGPCFTRDNSWPWVRLIGVGHEYAEVTKLRLVEGRWFTKEEEQQGIELVLINKPLAEGLFEGRSALGEVIDYGGERFEVLGVYESESLFAYGMIAPYPTVMSLGDESGRHVSSLAFLPLRQDLGGRAVSEMRHALAAIYSFDPEDDRVIDIEENTAFIAQVSAVATGLEWLVLTIAVIALVLGCLGAANVVGIAVAERTSEIGLRKAIGATSARVRAEVLAETIVLCLAGGLLGLLVGGATIAGLGPLELSDSTRLVAHVDAVMLFGGLLVLVATATLAGLPAANRAARLQPVVALRTE